MQALRPTLVPEVLESVLHQEARNAKENTAATWNMAFGALQDCLPMETGTVQLSKKDYAKVASLGIIFQTLLTKGIRQAVEEAPQIGEHRAAWIALFAFLFNDCAEQRGISARAMPMRKDTGELSNLGIRIVQQPGKTSHKYNKERASKKHRSTDYLPGQVARTRVFVFQ